jgi:hypothetical protein
LFSVQTSKEVRQLLPSWTAVAVTIVVLGQLGPQVRVSDARRLSIVMNLVYAVGTIALGALAIGHEYSHRTLASLLAQPIDRRRLLLRKLSVLGVALLGLMAVARWKVPAVMFASASGGPAVREFLLIPPMLAMCVAPWWTMASRGPLAGAVFSMAAPILITLGGDYLLLSHPYMRLRVGSGDVMWWGTVTLCAVGVLMTWWSFMRLEAIDGPQAEVGVPPWLRRSDRRTVAIPRARSRAGQLFRKELHLQQMTMLAASAYVVMWAGIAFMRRIDSEFLIGLLVPAQVMYSYLVALLAGAAASAEERQMGTADSQLLLPISTRMQWTIKAGTALALTALLSVGLPSLLATVHPLPDHLPDFERGFTLALMLTCAGALYVSSLSTSGMRALLTSLPVLAGAVFIAMNLNLVIGVLLGPFLIEQLLPYKSSLQPYQQLFREMLDGLGWGLALGIGLLLLTFAAANHRTVDRSRRRFVVQAGWVAVALVVGNAAASFLSSLARVALIRSF